METVVSIDRIKKVYGDRVLVKRLGQPHKRRGILVPLSYANGKKEPKKVWWGEIVAFGHESQASIDIGASGFGLSLTDLVGIEPIGSHYASFKGDDGNEYIWVPDEHICLADEGSIADFYSDHRNEKPRFRIIGTRILLRPVEEVKSTILRPVSNEEQDAKVAEIIGLGEFDGDIGLSLGDTVLHVAEESGGSALIDIFDPNLTILRQADIIARIEKELVQ